MKIVLDNLARMTDIANNIEDMKKFWSVAVLSLLIFVGPFIWVWVIT